jgi:MtfA peptidase
MRVMVAASAIQITHGYPDVYLNHFETIILYTDEYYSNLTGKYHKGEVNTSGAIVLSWNHFKSGFKDMNDGRNLAMHEMAHALRLANLLDSEDFGFIDSTTMQSFEQLAGIEMNKIDESENTFFRAYGATNLQEFFSVAVECFFERTKEFQAYNPGLYVLMTKILKLDLLHFRVDS